MGGLSHGREKTGIIYGVLEQLRFICTHRKVSSSRLMIFRDSKRSVRKSMLPAYKGKRSERAGDIERRVMMAEQLDMLVTHVFQKIGIPCFVQDGLESDDLIAKACEQILRRKECAVIITADSDLWQCVRGEQVCWFNPQRDMWIDEPGFIVRMGFAPSEWPMVKAIGGCRTDNVPGVAGIGERTAIEFVKCKHPAKFVFDNRLRRQFGKIRDSEAIINQMLKLVKLPHPMTTELIIKEPEYSLSAFCEMCKQFGIASYQEPERKREWKRILMGIGQGAERQRKRVRKRKVT